MPAATTALLGAVLTFGASDGATLQLTLSLTESATVSLDWGELTKTSTGASLRHVFRGLATPRLSPVEYSLRVGREPPRRARVAPLRSDQLRFVAYGDSRDGSAPHALLVRAMEVAAPDLVVHTGDLVRTANDDVGWVSHLPATLPLTAKTPLILSLGNHELAGAEDGAEAAMAKALRQIPPPDDPLARALGAPPSAFHVRVGPALFVSLDSNASLASGSPQLRFLDRALAERGDARWTFVSYHHGPRSSGPHGPHRDADAVLAVLARHGVSASIAGHDHVYERIADGGRSFVVTGGGGAPLYPRAARDPGSRTFASTYNWVLFEAGMDRVTLEARSLEGVLLDRATVAPLPPEPLPEAPPSGARAGAAAGLLAAALLAVAVRVVLRRAVV